MLDVGLNRIPSLRYLLASGTTRASSRGSLSRAYHPSGKDRVPPGIGQGVIETFHHVSYTGLLPCLYMDVAVWLGDGGGFHHESKLGLPSPIYFIKFGRVWIGARDGVPLSLGITGLTLPLDPITFDIQASPRRIQGQKGLQPDQTLPTEHRRSRQRHRWTPTTPRTPSFRILGPETALDHGPRGERCGPTGPIRFGGIE